MSLSKKDTYWVDFWNSNSIINKDNPQLQVGRSLKGIPITDDLWKKTLQFIRLHLTLSNQDTLLDIAAGTGLLAIPFSKIVKSVTAVDISPELMQSYSENHKITSIVSDIRDIDFEAEKFSKIVFYFALQHFTIEETMLIFEKLFRWTKKQGIVFIGDIPDINKIFKFFNTGERESAYFNSLKNEVPIIGTWFHREILIKMGTNVGFSKVEIVNQPSDFINAHYRFDLKLWK